MNFGWSTLRRRMDLRLIILAMTVLLIANVIVGVFFGLGFPIGYFSAKSVGRIASDLAFVEGALVFFTGALLMFFRPNVSRRAISLMIIGVAMLALSVPFGMF